MSFRLVTLCIIIFAVLSTYSEYVQQGKDNNSVYDKTSTNKQPATRSISAVSAKFAHKKNSYSLDRQPGLFSAITSLIGGSAVDTFTAYRNVTRLITNAFPPPRPGVPSNETATTFTVNQALQLFGRNYRGLRRLFDKEFVRALNDSDKNVMTFSADLKNSIRPFFEPNRNLTSPT